MNDKNYITQADNREETIPDDMRYTYIGSSVEIASYLQQVKNC